MLEIRNLHVRYGAIQALHGINLKVEQGQIVTLIGCNGAGKSTTLRAISGMAKCAGGDVYFEGECISNMPAHKIVQRGISHAPEGRGIFANLTVAENLELGAYIRHDRTAISADRDRMLNMFPRLRERLKQNAGTLSGGEQQMLAIARAVLSRPKLLLLDEPSLGLAPQIVLTIFKIIREINQAGTTILLVEQNAHMALKCAHYAYVLEVGSIVTEDQASVLAASDEVRKAYLGGA
ncbi:MAG TPA: ABC transporter ATP-binding protein [Phycisphaerales bacterium]|nr:ABC transporter ATP-binding protein [Phycisphaerales bacterium]